MIAASLYTDQSSMSGVPSPWAADRNWAAQQEVSGGRVSEASSAASHRSRSRLDRSPHRPRGKNCLPRNWSLVPKRLGTAALWYRQ